MIRDITLGQYYQADSVIHIYPYASITVGQLGKELSDMVSSSAAWALVISSIVYLLLNI